MLLDRKKIYSGKIVDLIVDQVEIKGQRYIREVVRHPGGVVVLAELPDGRIPFVRQSRYPIDRQLLELPAGKLDPGEEPAGSATREDVNLQFRSEFFNAFNTPHFLGAQFGGSRSFNVIGRPQAGKISAASEPRVIQFALKLLF